MTEIGAAERVRGGDDPLILRGVSKSYRTHFWQRPALSLDRLDLSVRAGEILGLLGPNGAGKTTAIKLALGLIFPDEGEIRMMGLPADDPGSRARVGYLPENPYFPDHLTGRELVHFAATLHGLERTEARRRTGQLLERVGLAAAADRPMRKYSKGMAQRAGMARVLVSAPRFVILDEPMSGLDPIGRREFRDLVLALRDDGVTVLFASHVLADAEMLCDRVAILKAGRLQAVSDLGRLERERRILGWEVEIDGEWEPPRGELIVVRGGERLWRLPAETEPGPLLEAAVAAGSRVRALVPQRETLEDLFVRSLEADAPSGEEPRR
jgi:ABC-2 type transport system ATP-binding protein